MDLVSLGHITPNSSVHPIHPSIHPLIVPPDGLVDELTSDKMCSGIVCFNTKLSQFPSISLSCFTSQILSFFLAHYLTQIPSFFLFFLLIISLILPDFSLYLIFLGGVCMCSGIWRRIHGLSHLAALRLHHLCPLGGVCHPHPDLIRF